VINKSVRVARGNADFTTDRQIYRHSSSEYTFNVAAFNVAPRAFLRAESNRDARRS